MCHLLKILFIGFRPADWWLLSIEFLVLGIIAWEFFGSHRKHRLVNLFTEQMWKGETLFPAIYSPDRSLESEEKLAQGLRQWMADSQRLVNKLPACARNLFARTQGVGTPLLNPPHSPEMNALIADFLNKRQALQRILGDRFTAGIL
jgi:hypothetical protein